MSDLVVNQNNEWESRLTVYDRTNLRSLWAKNLGPYSNPLLAEEPGGTAASYAITG